MGDRDGYIPKPDLRIKETFLHDKVVVMVRARRSCIFLKHCKKILLLFWLQEGGLLWITRNAEKTNNHTDKGGQAFDDKDPDHS